MGQMIETASLFPELNRRLIGLLQELNPGEWNSPTLFPKWKVKDIAAHLLDTSIRRLSFQRDNYVLEPGRTISTYIDLTKYLTDIADEWASALSRVSTVILIQLIEEYQNQLAGFLKTIDPYGTAPFSIAWAGEEKSFNWFDIAREYTERWHHQMQIRDVLNKPPLYDRNIYYPVIDTFMRALPYHYRDISADEGHILCVSINGEAGGRWYLKRKNQTWILHNQNDEIPHTIVTIENEAAWKIFVKWGDIKKHFEMIKISGDESLGRHILDMTCIMI